MGIVAASEAPRDVVRAAGDWIAERLALGGFRWLPGQRLFRRDVEGIVHEISLQPSRYNRRDSWISMQSRVGVRDPAVGIWRDANRYRVFSHGDHVCGTALGYASGRADGYRYGEFSDGELNLTAPGKRAANLEEWLAKVHAGVLPYLDEASRPETIVGSRAAEISGNPAGIVEWLVFRGHGDLVPAFVDYFLAKNPGWRAGVEEGRALAASGSALPVGSASGGLQLGWVLVNLQP